MYDDADSVTLRTPREREIADHNVLGSSECDECDYKTHTLKYLKGHISRFHLREGRVKCSECNYEGCNSSNVKMRPRNIIRHKSAQKAGGSCRARLATAGIVQIGIVRWRDGI